MRDIWRWHKPHRRQQTAKRIGWTILALYVAGQILLVSSWFWFGPLAAMVGDLAALCIFFGLMTFLILASSVLVYWLLGLLVLVVFDWWKSWSG